MPHDLFEPPSATGTGSRLNSWKEIATYLKCGVRTAQRWEKTEGCPIHRHLHQAQGSTYAFTSEIDAWLAERRSAHASSTAGQPISQLPTRVGRARELTLLETFWNRAIAGTRQIVFVDGAIGVGKTALVRSFLDRVDAPLIVHGQCVEQYGAGEMYLPVIEGLTRLLRDRSSKHLAMVMAKYAPSWLKHLPDFPNRESLRDEAPAGKPETIVRELVDTLERLADDEPVVLFLEDLHWSDWSTVELIERLARRPDPARLLIVATYRPGEWADDDHPLMRIHHELAVHGRCHEIRVPPLTREEVAAALSRRGPWIDLNRVTTQLHRWTGGVPLFLNVLIDHLIDTGDLTCEQGAWTLAATVATDTDTAPIAPRIRDIVDDRLQRLTSLERQLLEAASVAGHTFLAAVVAAAVGVPPADAERVFQALARRHQFVDRATADESLGDLITARYAFLHSPDQHIVYQQLSPSSRADLHRATGRFLESVHRSGRDEVAAEIARHFERARDFPRAAVYYDKAATVALGRNADCEAHACAVKAIECLAHVPLPSVERWEAERGGSSRG